MCPNLRKPLIYAQQYFCGKPLLKTIGKMCKFSTIILHINTSVISEWTLQSTCHRVRPSIGSSRIFVLSLNSSGFLSYSSCLKLRWQRNSLCSVNMPSLSGRKLYMEDLRRWRNSWQTKWAKFNFVHLCIGKLWLVVQAPVDFILNGLCTNQLICLISYLVL